MKENASHDQDPGYIFFNLKLAYDKFQTVKIIGTPDQVGYFAARVRMFLKEIDDAGIQPPSDMAQEILLMREAMRKYYSDDMENFSTNPGFQKNDTDLPPYEPFSPQGGVVSGHKQTAMYRLAVILQGLKLAIHGIKMTRGVSVTSLVKKEFKLKGNAQKLYDQFKVIKEEIMAGKKPLPGFPEEPYAWFKNRQAAPERPEHPFENMQNNPHRQKRLFKNEIQKLDSLDIRRLEMMLDAGHNMSVTSQFMKDLSVYGLREAYVYLTQYAAEGKWNGDIFAAKAMVNEIMKKHGRTNFVDNPSEPTYEPDPFRQDREEGAGDPGRGVPGYEETFHRLFQLARNWREASEAGDQQLEDQIHSDIRFIVQYIEANGLHAPQGMGDKYEKLYSFFFGQKGYQDNPGHGGRRAGAGRPKNMRHPERPFAVSSNRIPEVRFRTLNASVIYAREKAQEMRQKGIKDTITVMHPQLGLVAKYVTVGPVMEHRVRWDTREGTASGLPPAHGLIRHKQEFAENPWLVAGPEVNILPGTSQPGGMPPQVTPSVIKAGEMPAEGGEEVEEGADPASMQMVPAVSGAGSARAERTGHKSKIRSKIAKRQRRNSKGRFYDNPGPQYEEFMKVYEFTKRGLTFAGYFKFDSGRQIVTVRATELKDGRAKGYELDILADDEDAAHIFKMLKKRGFQYVVKSLKKKPFAVRAYEKDMHVAGAPSYDAASGYASGYKPTSGYASVDTAPSTGAILLPYKPTSTYGKSDLEIVSNIEALKRQIDACINEGNFTQAVGSYLKIRRIAKDYGSHGDAAYVLSWALSDARAAIDKRWPNAIKRFKDNRRK